MLEDNQLEFILERIAKAKETAENAKESQDGCSQHSKFVELHVLNLDVGVMNLRDMAEIKSLLKAIYVQSEGKPKKTMKELSFSLKEGLRLKGYGAWAAILIMVIMVAIVFVVGAAAMGG